MYGISPNKTKLTEVVASQDAVVTPSEVGTWLNLASAMVTAQTTMIQQLIDTAIHVVENYTWLNLTRKEFIAFYELPVDYFSGLLSGNYKLNLERSPVLAESDIGTIEYLNESNTFSTFDKGTLSVGGLYENVTEKIERREWASVYFVEPIIYQARKNVYQVKVSFTAGYDMRDGSSDLVRVPAAIKTAILMIVAAYYTNRGDCGDCDLNGFPVPCPAKSILDKWSIAGSTMGEYYKPACGCF